MNKPAKIIILLQFLTIILLGLYNLKTTSEKIQFQANNNLLKLNYQESLSQYRQAAQFWPLLKYDSEYQDIVQKVTTAISEVTNRPVAAIFINSEASENELKQIESDIKALSYVSRTKIITTSDAFKHFQQDPSFSELGDQLSENIFPHSIEVYSDIVLSKNQIESINNAVKDNTLVENFVSSEYSSKLELYCE